MLYYKLFPADLLGMACLNINKKLPKSKHGNFCKLRYLQAGVEHTRRYLMGCQKQEVTFIPFINDI